MSSVDGSLPGVEVTNVKALRDVDRYLNLGDFSTKAAIATPTVKGFLYLVHELVEVEHLEPILNAPASTAGPKPAVRVQNRRDPWERALTIARTRGADGISPVHVADTRARVAEVRVEQILARVLLGESISIDGLVWSISTATDPSDQPQGIVECANQDARQRTAAAIECGPEDEASSRLASEVRSRLLPLGTAHLETFTPSRLAYAIWEARHQEHGNDISDWLGAERALAAARG